MICPSCKDEFRPGFTRCAACEVDLVESLQAASAALPPAASAGTILPVEPRVRMVDYCGFLSLEDAREARDRLRNAGIRSEITIREAPRTDLAGALHEEFWIKVEDRAFEKAVALLGIDTAEAGDVAGGTFSCGDCGHEVGESETACPECGARFEDA